MKKIFFISDNEVLSRLWKYLLEQEGFEVFIYNEPDTFIERAKKEKPELCIVDSFMNSAEGFDFCKMLKSIPELAYLVCIIFVTNYNLLSSIERLKECDINDYWVKYDIRPKTLAARIRVLLGEPASVCCDDESCHSIRTLLLDSGVLTEEQIKRAEVCTADGCEFIPALLQSGAVIGEMMNCLHELHYKVDYIDLDSIKPLPEAIALVPDYVATQRKLVPLTFRENVLTVAMAEPWELPDIDYVASISKCLVQACYAPLDKIERAIMSAYSGREFRVEAEKLLKEEIIKQNMGFLDGASISDVIGERPVIDFMNSIIFEAIKSRASDIHIEYTEDDVVIRYRIDGVLHDVQVIPSRMGQSLVACVKIIAQMDVVEKRLPQDGRFDMRLQGNDVDFRVSTVPLSTGEKVVIRVLSKSNIPTNHADLGMSPEVETKYKDMIAQPHGMVLITGPTGSGKTTTLYATLNHLMSPEKNILSIEDPVEYDIKRVNQIQVNPKINLTFASILRHVLRQDPDIIMVGEIRDLETAELAAQASLTGHIVLGTLHTNDAPTGLIRLIDMGLPPFIVASTVTSLVAQRLMRRICINCKRPLELSKEDLRKLSQFKKEQVTETFHEGAGCSLCRKTGYQGRIGIFELLPVSERICSIIMANANMEDISNQAKAEGMTTLRDAAWNMAVAGISTLSEMWRVTRT